LTIDANNPAPIFEQIADHIRRSVAAGVYRAEEKLPSTRNLALELAVNPNTVQRAYEQLEREGLIQVKRGVGLFVTQDGANGARRHAADRLYETFRRAILAGRFARLPADEIHAVFRRALTDTDGQVPGETGGAS
jgi:GntR family transcriptional regulator